MEISHKIMDKILATILLIVIIVSYGVPGVIQSVVSLAANNDANDYNFTDELDTDRVGIGFTWTASTKTLTITAIKNSSALITLPEDSTIDIQGNIENTIKGINSKGKLTIKGNEKASIKITRCWNHHSTLYTSLYAENLCIESGNINIDVSNVLSTSSSFYYGISSRYITINDGNISVKLSGSGSIICAMEVDSICINGGNINLKSENYAISGAYTNKSKIEINGGTLVASSNSYCPLNEAGQSVKINGGDVTISGGIDSSSGAYYGAFTTVPSINPNLNWKILYNRTEDNLNIAKSADITEIYDIYRSRTIRIRISNPTTDLSVVSDKEEICVGEKANFIANIQPDNSTDSVNWSSSDSSIATVSKNGEVIGKAPGKVIITATSGDYTDSKEIMVNCKITLQSGIEGLEEQELYTDINGKLAELPSLSNNHNSYFEKWVDDTGNEVTLDTVYTKNTTIYATWTTREISVSNQENELIYGTEQVAIYEVNSNFPGLYDFEIENLPQDGGIILESNQINLVEAIEGIYKAVIKLHISNTVDACTISHLKIRLNNSITSNEFSLVIKKVQSNYEEPTGRTISYNGNAQELIVPGTTGDGILEYSIDNMNFSTKIPTGTEVGSYTIYYRVIGDKNHYNSETKNVVTKINKINSSIEKNPRAKILYYKEQEQELIEEGIANGGVMEYSLDGKNFSTNIPKAKEADIYTIYYRVKGDKNHNDITTIKQVVSIINKVDASLESVPTNKTLIYNGRPQELVRPGTTNDGTIEYSLDGENFTTEVPTAVKVGKYTIYYQIVGDKNHNNIEKEIIVSIIDKKDSDAELRNNFLNYNKQEQELVSVDFVDGGVILYSLDGENFGMKVPTAKEVGIYIIYYKVIGDSNHNNSEIKNVTSIISQADSEYIIVPSAKTLTYNGQEQELIVAGETEDGTIQYSLNNDKSFGTKIPTATEAGNYKIYYRILGDSNHNNSSIYSLEVTIKEKVEEKLPFTDVKETDWYYSAVKFNYENNMIKGINDTTFDPESNLTRGMLVTILHRMEGMPYVEGTSKFSDVKNTNDYYYVAVKWATQNDIVSGYNNGKFGPNDNITREQLAVILNQYCKYKGKYQAQPNNLNKFKDANKISAFAIWGMQWATGAGVITGSNGNLNPQGTTTRAEAASMLYKYCLNIK